MQFCRIPTIIAIIIGLSPGVALAQGAADYPTKAVRVIVGSSPGGAADIVARIFTDRMSENLKRQFVVENRPGAGDLVATGAAAKSPPDGYTLMVATPSFTLIPAMFPDFPHDPVKDFAPISLVAKAPLLMMAHPSLPAKSIKELIALAKAKPGTLDMAVVQGSQPHVASVHFNSLAGIRVTFIFYKGGAQIVSDMIGGQVPVGFVNVLAALPHARSGRLRALGVSSTERSSLLPDLPTISEQGLRGYDVSAWSGWFAPAGTPTAIVSKLNAELVKAVKSPDLATRLQNSGGEPIGTTAEQFRQIISEEISLFMKVVKEANIRMN